MGKLMGKEYSHSQRGYSPLPFKGLGLLGTLKMTSSIWRPLRIFAALLTHGPADGIHNIALAQPLGP
jgi:hypothetical protein